MKYDFTSIIDRVGKDSIAVDHTNVGLYANVEIKNGFDCIPMWVADMNFATVPAISEAIIERAEHPLFGYFSPSKAYYDAIINWHRERKGVTDLLQEHIGYENSVLGGVVSALNVLCSKGDNVLLHSPTYVGFTGSLLNNGYHIVHSELKPDEKGVYRMDFEDIGRL